MLRILRLVLVLAFVLPALAQCQSNTATVSREQFRSLDWIAGRWRGSGGNYPAFYEEYRFRDDSTIAQHNYTDSTFTTATDSSLIAWRNGSIVSGWPLGRYVVTEFQSTSLRFLKKGAARAGHTFAMVSRDQWTATLHPENAAALPVVYTMRRLPQP
ncbi:MAG: hypothetical protein ABI679_15865 [Gemmatimonadota bacterium]